MTRTWGCSVGAGGPADGSAPGGAAAVGGSEVDSDGIDMREKSIYFFWKKRRTKENDERKRRKKTTEENDETCCNAWVLDRVGLLVTQCIHRYTITQFIWVLTDTAITQSVHLSSDGYCYNTVYYSRYTITQSVHLGSDGFPTIIQSVDRMGGQSPPLLSPLLLYSKS